MSRNNTHFNPEKFGKEKTQGYLDGWESADAELSTSQDHRSASYRYGWSTGRDDRLDVARVASAIETLRSDAALATDMTPSAT